MKLNDLILGATSIGSLFILYFFSNIPHETMYDLSIFLDHYIPFVPVFILPYISYFALIPVTIIGVVRFSFALLRPFFMMLLGTILFSHACFWIFPTHLTVRPEICNADIFSELTKLLYSIDEPYSACPSLHANISTLCALIWWQLRHRYSGLMILWACLVIVSTVFMKQHFVVDIPAGILSAFFWYWIIIAVTRWYPLTHEEYR